LVAGGYVRVIVTTNFDRLIERAIEDAGVTPAVISTPDATEGALMQAIARVNRVFRDKPGGLVVDYLGLADQLKRALATYTESGGQGQPSIDTAEAIAVMLEKYEVCCDMMHGFDWSKWTSPNAVERIGLLPPAQEHILTQDDGKARWGKAVKDVSQAFALCAASDSGSNWCDP
jgi:type I restriction enzyme R subunit